MEKFIQRWCYPLKLIDLPDISFVEINPEKTLNDIITDYEDAYFESTGKRKKLYPGDPIRIFLYTQALREIQLRQVIDDTAKQNLLKYARGERLENLGAMVKTYREKEKASKTRMKISFSQNQQHARILPAGIRFSNAIGLYFVIRNEVVLPAGDTELIVEVDCEQAGEVGNGIQPGEINIMVDQLPFMVSAINLDVTQGGVDEESDERFRERIHLAPEGFSVAGPDGAYIYHAKSYSSLIEDIKATSVKGTGVVDLTVLLKNGEIPSESFLVGLQEYFTKDIKPLTDFVQARAPEKVHYDIEVTYYISSKNFDTTEEIKSKIETAFNKFLLWQKSKIGRDINPSELVFLLRDAGAKRVEVISPTHIVVNDNQVAQDNSVELVFGGLEDD